MINLEQLKEKLINEESFAVIIENSEIKKMNLSTIKRLREIKKTNKKSIYVTNY